MLSRLVLLLALIIMPLSSVAAKTVTILAFGDSLTAGLGLSQADSFPAKLETALKARGHDVRVINAGVSGDTSADGRDRIEWSLTDEVDAVILELGANDALRGLDPKNTKIALQAILSRIVARQRPVLIAGMRAPRNLGPQYGEAFDRIFPDIVPNAGALLYPFFLDGVAADPGLNQADGIHPNAKGVDVIVALMLPKVEELIALAASK